MAQPLIESTSTISIVKNKTGKRTDFIIFSLIKQIALRAYDVWSGEAPNN